MRLRLPFAPITFQPPNWGDEMLSQVDVLRYLIAMGPGRTANEFTRAIHAGGAYQQRVNQDCAMLWQAGKVERRGAGGPAEPYRYFPRP
jgi:hypothetical protein